MMKKNLMVGMIMLLGLASCSEKQEKPTVAGVEVETIKADVSLTDSIPADYAYILLENCDGAQMMRPRKVVKAPDGTIWIAADVAIRHQSLFNFTADGKWIKTLDKLGQGPDEYLSITDFDISPEGDIWILDARIDDIKIYDKEGKFRRKLKPKFEPYTLQLLDNGNILFGLASWDETVGKEWKVILADSSAQPLKYIVPADGLFDPNILLGESGFSRMNDGRIVYNREIDDRIYVFGKNGELEAVTELDFGKYRVTDEDRKQIMDNPNFDHYRFIVNRVGVIGDKYVGTLKVDNKLAEFAASPDTTLIQLTDPWLRSMGFIDDKMVQAITGDEEENISLPDSVKAHIAKEGQTLRLVQFK